MMPNLDIEVYKSKSRSRPSICGYVGFNCREITAQAAENLVSAKYQALLERR